MNFIDLVNEILIQGTIIANDSFGKVSSQTKPGDNNQVLTETDLKIGQTAIEKIQKVFPTHNLIDEEAGIINNNSEYTWVIDPIDGTSNFASHIPTFGIIIGLLYKSQPIAGGIALPFFNKIYLAEEGKGASCNNKAVHISKETSLDQTLVSYQLDGPKKGYDISQEECSFLLKLLPNIRNLRTNNSVFDASMVAEGNYGGILNRSTRIWDNVGQQIVIEEAGGIYTDFFGKPMDYSNMFEKVEDHFTYCAASPILHKQLQTLIHG